MDIAGQQVLHPFLLSKVPADKLAIDGINALHRPMLLPSRDQLNHPDEFLLFGAVGVLKVFEANQKGPVPRLAPGPYHYCLAGTKGV